MPTIHIHWKTCLSTVTQTSLLTHYFNWVSFEFFGLVFRSCSVFFSEFCPFWSLNLFVPKTRWNLFFQHLWTIVWPRKLFTSEWNQSRDWNQLESFASQISWTPFICLHSASSRFLSNLLLENYFEFQVLWNQQGDGFNCAPWQDWRSSWGEAFPAGRFSCPWKAWKVYGGCQVSKILNQ